MVTVSDIPFVVNDISLSLATMLRICGGIPTSRPPLYRQLTVGGLISNAVLCFTADNMIPSDSNSKDLSSRDENNPIDQLKVISARKS